MNSNNLPSSDIGDFFNGNMRPAKAFSVLSHFDQLFPSRVVSPGTNVRELPPHPASFPGIEFQGHGKTCDLNDFLATNRVTGLLVLKDGKLILENYELGLRPDMRWASCSIAKSIAGTLLGAALQDGSISSLGDPVSQYVPILGDGPYRDISVGDILSMTSGIAWDETYLNPNSERRELLSIQTKFQPDVTLRFMNTLRKVAEPGTLFNYNTGESYILGAIIEAAIQRPLSDYLSEKIWSKAGMEQDATWWMDSPHGRTISHGGMTATLRDYGRFGQFVLENGVIGETSIVPQSWFGNAASPHTDVGESEFGYSHGWWIPPRIDPRHIGAFQAEGIYGQYIYVHPKERVVIVLLSARSKPSASSRLEWNDELFFATVVKALET